MQIFALADILIFRFIIRISIAETAGWIGFVFLQVSIIPPSMFYDVVDMFHTGSALFVMLTEHLCVSGLPQVVHHRYDGAKWAD